MMHQMSNYEFKDKIKSHHLIEKKKDNYTILG
jgi:hypothetical protein